MIDEIKLAEIIDAYKESFSEHRPNERYKWEAVKTFQDNWKPNDNTIDFLTCL